jgi:hypothetical protein
MLDSPNHICRTGASSHKKDNACDQENQAKQSEAHVHPRNPVRNCLLLSDINRSSETSTLNPQQTVPQQDLILL